MLLYTIFTTEVCRCVYVVKEKREKGSERQRQRQRLGRRENMNGQKKRGGEMG